MRSKTGWTPYSGSDGDWTAGFKLADHSGSVSQMIKAAGGKVWSPFYGDVTKENITRAHGAGLKVIPWTVNDEASMKNLIVMGVDGLISDYPDRLRAVLNAMKITTPPATPVDP